ncbi:MAG: PorV/PorQ family protein [Melioribacteraceae bacterium]|nr:PorV/PorQ family protein [Melioribacteraceae bacterium]MCF8265202.1 PorV/PorQ family protein [Melioribacteraceae bacterium]
MRYFRKLSTLLIMIGITVSVPAQNITKVATTAAPFLTIGVGARAQSMGGAFVAQADDASALFWNVGGIAQLEKTEFVINHSAWIADIDYNFVGMVAPIAGIGAVGISVMQIDYGNFEQTTELRPEGTGVEFSASSIAMNLSYARALTDRFMFGFNIKYIEENLFNSTASGIAMDVGFLFITPIEDIRLGMSISNFGNKLKMSGDDLLVKVDIDQTINGNNDQINARIETREYDLPLLFRFGIAYDIINSNNNRLTVAVDALHPNDNAESVNLGGEFVYDNLLALRAGYSSLFRPDSEEGFTIGGGIYWEKMGLRLDYAYESFGRLSNIQKYTLHFMF